MKSYGQFCPLARACEVLAERWTPLVLRELLTGATRFGEIHRGVPLMSRSLLVTRLRELEEVGVLRSSPLPSGHGSEYRVTEAGEELRPFLAGLARWGGRWARRSLEEQDLDAGLLLASIAKYARPPGRGEARLVVRIELSGLPRGQFARHTWWLVLHRGDCTILDSDLTGASFMGVWGLETISWDNVICPDGSHSDADDGDGFTCLDNLIP